MRKINFIWIFFDFRETEDIQCCKDDAYDSQNEKSRKLHILSLVLLALFWAAAAYENISCPEAIPITLFLLWLNIWCLMLQRYHYLRIRQLQEKHFRLRNPEKP